METLEYRTIDKTEWPRGEWDAEPDKRQWQDAGTKLPCLIVRGPAGALCGYVGVPESHPYHGKDYDDLGLEVHGGITFAHGCAASADESRGICHRPAPGESDHVWWLGFDCAHAGDYSPKFDRIDRLGEPTGWGSYTEYRNIAYVEAQCQALAAQLAQVAPR